MRWKLATPEWFSRPGLQDCLERGELDDGAAFRFFNGTREIMLTDVRVTVEEKPINAWRVGLQALAAVAGVEAAMAVCLALWWPSLLADFVFPFVFGNLLLAVAVPRALVKVRLPWARFEGNGGGVAVVYYLQADVPTLAPPTYDLRGRFTAA